MGGLTQPDPTKSSESFVHEAEELTAKILGRKEISEKLDEGIQSGEAFEFVVSLNGDAMKGTIGNNLLIMNFTHKEDAETVDKIGLTSDSFKTNRVDVEVIGKSEPDEASQARILKGLRKINEGIGSNKLNIAIKPL